MVWSVVADYTGPVVGEVPSGLPPFSLALPWSRVTDLAVAGAVIALVGFAEPAAIARTFATQDRRRWNPDREFVSQGLANVVSGVSGGFPVGGSFSRSSINRLSGGKSRWSGAVTGLVVLVFIPFAGVLEQLPAAVLGAIVIVGVANLIDVRSLVDDWNYSRLQGLVGIATFVLTLQLASRIDIAVLIGIGLGVAVHIWRELEFEVRAEVREATLLVQPHGVLYFGSAPAIGDKLTELLADFPTVDEVRFDLSSLGRIDYSGAVVLLDLVKDTQTADLVVTLHRIPPQARRILGEVWEGELADLEVRSS